MRTDFPTQFVIFYYSQNTFKPTLYKQNFLRVNMRLHFILNKTCLVRIWFNSFSG